MTGPAASRRWRDGGQRLLTAVAFLGILGTLALIGANAALLGRQTTQLQLAQTQAAALNNAAQEMVRLLQKLAELGETSDPDEIAVQRGLLGRQIQVASASFGAGAPESRALDEIWSQVRAYDWDSLPERGGHTSTVRIEAISALEPLERRLNAVRSAEEKQFYTTTIESLAAKRRSQVGLGVLVSLVLVLGTASLIGLVRRRRNDIAEAYLALKEEVTERRALEAELTRQAHHDSLTGLPNRARLLARLGEAMAELGPEQGCLSVILIDLDGFKHVNDTFGHIAGDELLLRVAERLRGCVLTGDLAARLGGDEFAIVVTSGRPEHAVAVARRVVNTLGQPITVSGHEVSIGASVGVAHRGGTESPQDLLRDADIAMYVAKHTGKHHYEVFEPDMRTRASERTGLQQHLARAVELGEIEVHYQPIVDLRTGGTASLEALARWRHPNGSLVPPDVFIPIAEDSGAIIGIGREVLRQACRATRDWRDRTGRDDLGISVNVSVHQVLAGGLVQHVTEALAGSRLPASALTLEITESTLLEESDRVAAEFARLKELGVRIAVDDFGSGYSSLSFLLRLDADVLKIDRTLLDFDTTRHGSMVQAISDLGRTLGLTVVVEGVETAEHLARAREALCDAAQGYYFARPMQLPDVAVHLGIGAPAPGAELSPAST